MMSELVMYGRVVVLFVLDTCWPDGRGGGGGGGGSVTCVQGLFFLLIMISGDFFLKGVWRRLWIDNLGGFWVVRMCNVSAAAGFGVVCV